MVPVRAATHEPGSMAGSCERRGNQFQRSLLEVPLLRPVIIFVLPILPSLPGRIDGVAAAFLSS